MSPTTPDSTAVERIDAVLPQIQCRQCGYAGCHPYAKAIAAGAADINRCPPGGDAAIGALARLLGRAAKPLDTACGTTKPPAVALIDETWCIGCTLCIQACPVDAIAGAPKLMHTVIAAECTGCELCIPPCPVDCISMQPVVPPAEPAARAAHWRNRYRARERRLAASAAAPKAAQRKTEMPTTNNKQAAIARALERAHTRIQKFL